MSAKSCHKVYCLSWPLEGLKTCSANKSFSLHPGSLSLCSSNFFFLYPSPLEVEKKSHLLFPRSPQNLVLLGIPPSSETQSLSLDQHLSWLWHSHGLFRLLCNPFLSSATLQLQLESIQIPRAHCLTRFWRDSRKEQEIAVGLDIQTSPFLKLKTWSHLNLTVSCLVLNPRSAWKVHCT